MNDTKSKKKPKRADQLVFESGLAESSEQGKRLIMAGKVYVKEPGKPSQRVDKPGQQFSPDTNFAIEGISQYVSRGAYKLLTALEHCKIDVTGYVALDAGASTGGFSDCLVQHGAVKVYAVDVGHNQLHERLKADPRIVSMEGVNLRTCGSRLLPEKVDLLVADLSFISLTLILPPCTKFLKPGAKVIALIKPQFELEAGNTEKGIVRDSAKQQEAIDKVLNFAVETLGFEFLGLVPSAVKGSKGNQEFLAIWNYPG